MCELKNNASGIRMYCEIGFGVEVSWKFIFIVRFLRFSFYNEIQK